MIQDIKKYNVWIVYVCMWLFSFFTVWYIAIVMYYTLVHVTQSGYASDFIKNISTLSNVPIRSFYIAVFGFIGFVVEIVDDLTKYARLFLDDK